MKQAGISASGLDSGVCRSAATAGSSERSSDGEPARFARRTLGPAYLPVGAARTALGHHSRNSIRAMALSLHFVVHLVYHLVEVGVPAAGLLGGVAELAFAVGGIALRPGLARVLAFLPGGGHERVVELPVLF